MQANGCKLSAEDIYSVNQSSLKDAVLIFGGGCTGELVSNEGLVLTNHHCGYSSIQSLSSVEHNYLRDGFWATNKNEELPCYGLSVQQLIRIEDVTAEIFKGCTETMSADEKNEQITKNRNALASKIKKESAYTSVSIDPFQGGDQYLAYVYK